MSVFRLGLDPVFPDPREADPDGLLAVGGDLCPERLLAAYAAGIFPWYDRPPILWFSPDPRMVLVPDSFHVARRLRRTLRQGVFSLRCDSAFGTVIRACASVPRRGQLGTWITPEMVVAYEKLHELGFAHSCEAWQAGRLVGGVYGVSLGRAFFAESMFHVRSDASRVALAALVFRLQDWGFDLIDCQLPAPHLATLGAEPWPRQRFLDALRRSISHPTRPGPWSLDN
jgi:leucyl/phenylalanyl-tRNA--protein transferase